MNPQPEKIRQMFSEIAGRYDLANTVLSAGIHHWWRKAIVEWSGATRGDRVLDCATGTGDLAIEFKKTVGPEGLVMGTDFCADMLGPAPAKARKANLLIEFEQADVMDLPYDDGQFDISSIAFGIRNVSDPVLGLRELGRVTKPGGVVMILEFGQPQVQAVRRAYDFYSQKVLPKVGGWLTGRPEAYEYLQNSSSEFPCGEEFLKLVQQTELFEHLEFKPLSMGIAYAYRLVRKQN